MSIGERFRLDGRVAVVTGGGGGIGAAGALAMAEAGADIALIARNRAKLDEAAAAVRCAGKRALVIEADVVETGAMEAAREAVLAEFGHADILFNNAGITSPKLFIDLPAEEWARVIEVNLNGVYNSTRAFLPGMRAQRSGRIINMGSILSTRGMAARTVYCTTKAGLANFGAALAFEVGEDGVTVNTLGATVIVTDLNRELTQTQPELYARVIDRQAIRRLGQLDDLTGAIVFLASDAARFITGQAIFVDGGFTAG